MRIKLTEGTISEDVSGTGVVIDARGNAAVLNGTADYILEGLLSKMSADEVSKALCSKYEVLSEVAQSDIRAVVDALVGYGMIEEA